MADVTERGVFDRVVRRRRAPPPDIRRHGSTRSIDDGPPRWQDRPRVLEGLDPRARFWRVMEALLPPRLLAALEAAEDTLATRRPGPPHDGPSEPVLMPRLARVESWPPLVEGQAHDPRQLNFSFNFAYTPAAGVSALFEAPALVGSNDRSTAVPSARARPAEPPIEDGPDATVPRTGRPAQTDPGPSRREPRFDVAPAEPLEPVAVPIPARLRESAAGGTAMPALGDEPLVLRARDLGDPPWDGAARSRGGAAAPDVAEAGQADPEIAQAKRPRRRRIAEPIDRPRAAGSNPRLFLLLVGLLVLLVLAAAIAIHPDDFGLMRSGDAGASGPIPSARRVVHETVEPNEAERISAERSRQFARFLLDDAQRLRPGPERDRALERVIDFALEADQPDEALKMVPAMSRRRDVDRALWRIFTYSVERRRLNLADQVAFQFSYDSDRERARQIVVDAGARLFKP